MLRTWLPLAFFSFFLRMLSCDTKDQGGKQRTTFLLIMPARCEEVCGCLGLFPSACLQAAGWGCGKGRMKVKEMSQFLLLSRIGWRPCWHLQTRILSHISSWDKGKKFAEFTGSNWHTVCLLVLETVLLLLLFVSCEIMYNLFFILHCTGSKKLFFHA